MKYTDEIYGQFEITEPVLLDLINCPAIQRLKDVDQGGYSKPFFNCVDRTRYDHSMGVFLLLRKYGASLEEQIAGLIHDVSHTAFSHITDYVLEGGSVTEQTFQDNIFHDFVQKTDIPEIHSKDGLDVEYVLDEGNFPWLERDLPHLCADRIDYSFRDGVVIGLVEPKEADYYLDHLQIIDDQWVFDNFDAAHDFAKFFKFMNENYFAGFKSVVMFQTVKDYLKHSLEKGYVEPDDFFMGDSDVLAKIAKHHQNDEQLDFFFKRMNNKYKCADDPDKNGEFMTCKSRAVDPLCQHSGDIRHVSDIEPSWGEIVQQESVPKEYWLKFEE